MEPDVVFCTKEEALEAAMQKMLGRKVYKLLPVVDASHRIVAVLSLISLLECALGEEA